jgi:aspartyl-tRNA(Asn)/glutamyl-tRNA(Gln) amidotransferase subunit C
MTFDLKVLKRTAELARLQIDQDPAAANRLATELAALIGHINVLTEAETQGVEPLYSPVSDVPGPRPDEPGRGADPEDLLDQAPERAGRFFSVPKII